MFKIGLFLITFKDFNIFNKKSCNHEEILVLLKKIAAFLTHTSHFYFTNLLITITIFNNLYENS